jgi:hypothetical protein
MTGNSNNNREEQLGEPATLQVTLPLRSIRAVESDQPTNWDEVTVELVRKWFTLMPSGNRS